MAANKPGKAEILAAFFDDGTYSPLFTDGAVSAAYGCANGQNAMSYLRTALPSVCRILRRISACWRWPPRPVRRS